MHHHPLSPLPPCQAEAFANDYPDEIVVADPPSPIRSQAAAMLDDIYVTIVQAAGGDDETVSLALSRNAFDLKVTYTRISLQRNCTNYPTGLRFPLLHSVRGAVLMVVT